jgi:hypothetical protein
MTSTVEVTGRDRERAVKAYVKVLEEEGYWTKPGFKWDPTDPSISIIASHIAAAREEGRQEERRRWREWYDGLPQADRQADWSHGLELDRRASAATEPMTEPREVSGQPPPPPSTWSK